MAPSIISCVSDPSLLDGPRTIYVPDTNVVLSYPFLIPNPAHPVFPINSPIDLTHSHIIIPILVDNELDQLKGQHISISYAASNAIKRLDALTEENFHSFSLENAFAMKNNLRIQYTNESTGQNIDLLFGCWLVNDDISAPPFYPSTTDADGKIIASILNIKNSDWYKECPEKPQIIALSNDYNFRFRCRLFGLKAQPFNTAGPNTRYSGRRTVSAPRILYSTLVRQGQIPGNIWRQYMPDEIPLLPNEFIVFRIPQTKPKPQPTPNKRSKRKHGRPNKPTIPKEPPIPLELSPKLPSERFNFIGRYDAQIDSIVSLKYLDSSPVAPENIGQAIHIEAMMNPQIGVIIVDNTPHYDSTHVATVSYRAKEPAFTDDIYDKFNFN